ncbi:hypothetical protein [Bradyrhizobium sp. SZCCHNR1004]|uniref:hypothetical protein n=1 Tax=Bradyrhizobium sp. SZCCHNR1004 TaxID=3057335 RepID=UPI002916F5F1|nr:hypothetical protein [Bradyrhizobium sp. SZCCHNR1004]
MSAPTIRDALKGEQSCDCGWTHRVEDHEKALAVDDLMERVERLEAHLGLSE